MSLSNVLIKELFDGLAGNWYVERIVDGLAAVSGSASFKKQQPYELLYAERGLVKLSDGKQLFARQSYIYRFEEGSVSVYFDEEPQRLFHHIEFELGSDDSVVGRGSHQCKEDFYRAVYRFSLVPNFGKTQKNNLYLPGFQIEYRVDGPLKHSTILCNYEAQIEE